MARICTSAEADEELPDVADLVGRCTRVWPSASPAHKRALDLPATTTTLHARPRHARGQDAQFTAQSVVNANNGDSGVASQARRQRPLKHISGNSMLAPLSASEKSSLARRGDIQHADIQHAENKSRPVRQTPRREVQHMQPTSTGPELHEDTSTIVEEPAPSPANSMYSENGDSASDSQSDDSLEAIKFWGGRNPRPTPRVRKVVMSSRPVLPPQSTRQVVSELTPRTQRSGDITDHTASAPSSGPGHASPCLDPSVPSPDARRPASCDGACNGAILTFDPPTTRSPRKAPPRPTTPAATASTPPPSPGKGRLLSPSKKAPHIAAAPFRPSIDAFWSATSINEWNDRHSPRKDCLTSPRKRRFRKDPARPASACSLDDGGYESPTTSTRRSPAKAADPRAARRKAFEADKHALAERFLLELDQRITGGRISELARETGGVKLVWSKRLNSTAGRANWRRETVRRAAADGANTASSSSLAAATTRTICRHEASIELAEKVIDDEERLLNVVAHEFCHLANFMISGVKDRPHGKEFKQWAAKVTHAFGDRGVEVTTKHSYAIDYKYIWECVQCGLEYKRHSKSIDPARHSCGSCKSRLVQTRPKPRKAAVGGYAGFVKEHFARVKKENAGASHGAVMETLARMYREQKDAVQTPSPISLESSESVDIVDDIADALDAVGLDD